MAQRESISGRRLNRQALTALLLAAVFPAVGAVAVLLIAGKDAPAGVRAACTVIIILATVAISTLAFKMMYDVVLGLCHLLGWMKSALGEMGAAAPHPPAAPPGRLGGDLDEIAGRFRQTLADLAAHAAGLEEQNRRLQRELEERAAWFAGVLAFLLPGIEEIRQSSRVLAGEEGDREARGRHAAAIRRRSEDLHRRLEDLLLLERLEAGEYTWSLAPLDLAAAAERAAAALEPFARQKNVRLQRNFAAASSRVYADAAHLERSLVHLLHNAVKFSRPGGAVHLLLEQPGGDGQWVRLTVADNGPGIPPERLPRIFDRFARAAPAPGQPAGTAGTGVGLALARRVVELHGGQLTARSRPDTGSMFSLALPAWRDLPQFSGLLAWKIHQARALNLPLAVLLVRLPRRGYAPEQLATLCRGLAPLLRHSEAACAYHQESCLGIVLNADEKMALAATVRLLGRLEEIRLPGLPPLSRAMLRHALWSGPAAAAEAGAICAELEARLPPGRPAAPLPEETAEEAPAAG